MRRFARVGPNSGTPKVIHRIGPSPSEQDTLPSAALLVIDSAHDGTFLYRFSERGDFAGDTWHGSVDEAEQQARFEYGPLTWEEGSPVPSDAHEFAMSVLNELLRVYADFMNTDGRIHPDGLRRILLNTQGTREDLERQGIELRENLKLLLYSDDADNDGRSDPLLVEGTVHFDSEHDQWLAVIDWGSLRHESDLK
jgi:hypothetical protein